MNYTTEDYLNQLEQDREDFIDNLETKGITGLTGDETFTELVPEVLNITGGGSTDIYKVASIAERNALTGVKEDDMCVVYVPTTKNWQESTNESSITFPQTVELPSAFTNWYSGMLEADQSSGVSFDCMVELYEQGFSLSGWGDTLNLGVSYYSEDGITYERQDLTAEDTETGDSYVDGDTINLPFSVCINGEWVDEIGYFMQTDGNSLYGIYTYKGGVWFYTDIGINQTGSNYLIGSTGYTNSGVTQGVFPSGTKENLNFLVNYRVGSFTLEGNVCEGLFKNNTNLKELGFDFNTTNTNTMKEMFSGCTNLESIDVSGFDTSSVTDMSGMFNECSSIESIDISTFDLSNVTDMSTMFFGCSSLSDINVEGTNTNNLLSLYTTFRDTAITSIDLSSWDLSKVYDMSALFMGCTSLVSVTFNNEVTITKLSQFASMFQGCTSLEEVDLSFLGTQSGERYPYCVIWNGAFEYCSSLKRINLCNLHLPQQQSGTSRITNYQVFYGCNSLEFLDIRSFQFSIFTDNMGGNIFGSASVASSKVPANCLIIVKDSTEKSWITSRYTWLTNVKTVDEYEASLNS